MIKFVPTTLVVCGSSFLPALSTDKDNVGKWLCTHPLATRAAVVVIIVAPLPGDLPGPGRPKSDLFSSFYHDYIEEMVILDEKKAPRTDFFH